MLMLITFCQAMRPPKLYDRSNLDTFFSLANYMTVAIWKLFFSLAIATEDDKVTAMQQRSVTTTILCGIHYVSVYFILDVSWSLRGIIHYINGLLRPLSQYVQARLLIFYGLKVLS